MKIAQEGSKRDQPLAGVVFVESLTVLKNLLNNTEDRYDGKKDSKGYIYHKGILMDEFYKMLERIFKNLKEDSLIEECGCGANISKVRTGYKPCKRCYGSGYCNKN
jgi:hypothetical protein